MTLESLSSILAIIIAVSALIFSIRAEMRSNKRLDLQLEREEKVAHANIRPLVIINHKKSSDSQSIIIRNRGMGPAIITDISISKNGKKAKNSMVELFDFPKSFTWNTNRIFRGGRQYLSHGKRITLVKIDSEKLEEQEFSSKEVKEILQSFQEQSEGITIEISYEDTLDEEQKLCKKTLHS